MEVCTEFDITKGLAFYLPDYLPISVAIPGFPKAEKGCQPIVWQFFGQKLHANEEGADLLSAPLIRHCMYLLF